MRILLRKDTKLDTTAKVLMKYLVWAVIGAIIGIIVFYAPPTALISGLGILAWAGCIMGMAMLITGARENHEHTGIKPMAKIMLGSILLIPLLWAFGAISQALFTAIMITLLVELIILGISMTMNNKQPDPATKKQTNITDPETATELQLSPDTKQQIIDRLQAECNQLTQQVLKLTQENEALTLDDKAAAEWVDILEKGGNTSFLYDAATHSRIPAPAETSTPVKSEYTTQLPGQHQQ